MLCVIIEIHNLFIYSKLTLNIIDSLFLVYLDPSMKCFYIKAKHFEHYHYVNNLAKDCELRLEKVIRDENRRKYVSDKDVMIKVIGNHSDDNLKFLSKVKGKLDFFSPSCYSNFITKQ